MREFKIKFFSIFGKYFPDGKPALATVQKLGRPNNPREAVESRKNEWYGFAVVVDARSKPDSAELASFDEEFLSLFKKIQGGILASLNPRDYAKQEFFHGSIFGMTPLKEKLEYLALYADSEGILNSDRLETMAARFQTYLNVSKPALSPAKCELLEDGSVVARFNYVVSDDEKPLLTLAERIDPEMLFPKWGPTNTLHNTTVAVVIAVIDLNKTSELQENRIRKVLDEVNVYFKTTAHIEINGFWLISFYEQRTLSINAIEVFSHIGHDKIVENPLCHFSSRTLKV